VTFYYNDSFPTNIDLFNYYTTLVATINGKPDQNIYNRTYEIESNFKASYTSLDAVSFSYGSFADFKADRTDNDPDDIYEGGEESETPPENIPEGGEYAKIKGYDSKCSAINGDVVLMSNTSDGEKFYDSDTYDFRYVYVLVFDKDGICIEAGNNLLMEKTDPGAQNGVTVPAGGFAVGFYYNAPNSVRNEGLYNIYTAATEGQSIANSTMLPAKEIKGEVEGDYIILSLTGKANEIVSEPSEDESVEESEEAPSEGESEEVSDEVSEGESSEEPADESSDEETASAEASMDEEASAEAQSEADATGESSEESVGNTSGGLPTGAIIGIIAAAVAVIAVVAVIIVKKKK